MHIGMMYDIVYICAHFTCGSYICSSRSCVSYSLTYFDREIIYMFKLNQKHVLDKTMCAFIY